MARVLVVDSNPDCVVLLSEVLSLANHSVCSGVPALLTIYLSVVDAEVIVYACRPAVEPCEPALIRSLLVRYPTLRDRLILLTTSPEDRGLVQLNADFGPLRILTMPFDVDHLVETVSLVGSEAHALQPAGT